MTAEVLDFAHIGQRLTLHQGEGSLQLDDRRLRSVASRARATRCANACRSVVCPGKDKE